MFKRWLEKLAARFVARRDQQEAAAVAALYADTLESAVEETHNPRSRWLADYEKVEVPGIGPEQDNPIDVVTPNPSPVRHCVCAVSSVRYPGRFSANDGIPVCRI